MKNLKSKILIIGIIGLTFFIGIGNAKASAGNILQYDNFYNSGSLAGTITTGTNQIMLCEFSSSYVITNVSWNGQNMTDIKLDEVGYYKQTFYLVNPSLGTYPLNVSTASNYGVQCNVYENVDQTNPIYATSTLKGTPDVINTWNSTQTPGAQVIIPYLQNSNNATDPTIDNTGNWGQYIGIKTSDSVQTFLGSFFGTTNSNSQISVNISPDVIYHWYIELKIKPPPPPPGGTISSIAELFTPNLTVDTKKGWDISYLWNTCNNFSTINKATVSWLPDNTPTDYYAQTVVQDKTIFIGPQQCNGTGELKEYFNNNLPSTGTGTLRMILTHTDGTIENIDKTLSYDTSSYNYWIGSSTNIPDFNLNALNQSTTTPITINWSLNATLWASSTLELYNLTDNTITATTTPTSNFGGDVLNMNTPGQDESKLYQFIGIMNDGTKLYSNKFKINFFTTVNTTGNFLGTSTSAVVCSPTEWNNPDPVFNWGFGTSTVPAFNFTKIRCNVEKSGLDIAIKIGQIPNSILNTTGKIISNIFPFNIPIGILKSWNDSANTNLPTELTFLTPEDANGNLTVIIPASIGGTTSTIEIIGPTVFANNTQLSGMFENIRNLSTYLIWFGLLGEIFILGKKIINDLNESEDDDTKDKLK